jgi:hypothetical protein
LLYGARSVSERSDPRSLQWRGFVRLYLGLLYGGVAALAAFTLLIDPFDSGRTPVPMGAGVSDLDPRFSRASQGRDPQFDSAILGNSHGQALNPTRLARETGLGFVQLTVPGTGPREQLTLLRWFFAHHARIGGIVVVADETWCTQDPSQPTPHPFPFWLYDGWLRYLPHLLSTTAFDRARRRVALALGLRERDDPTGFMDYEVGATWAFRPEAHDLPAASAPSSTTVVPAFPGIERLADAIGGLPPAVPVVIVMPPVFYTALPAAGSSPAIRLGQCATALAQLASARSRGRFLDFRVDDAMTRDPRNFMDYTHYRSDLARVMERDIAAALMPDHGASRYLNPAQSSFPIRRSTE